jgi:hypothetical protein
VSGVASDIQDHERQEARVLALQFKLDIGMELDPGNLDQLARLIREVRKQEAVLLLSARFVP